MSRIRIYEQANPATPPANSAEIFLGTDNIPYVIQENGTITSMLGGGSLPGGSANFTFRHNGSAWVSSNLLLNTSTAIGIGITPSRLFHVHGNGGGAPLVRLSTSGSTANEYLLEIGSASGGTAYGFVLALDETTGDLSLRGLIGSGVPGSELMRLTRGDSGLKRLGIFGGFGTTNAALNIGQSAAPRVDSWGGASFNTSQEAGSPPTITLGNSFDYSLRSRGTAAEDFDFSGMFFDANPYHGSVMIFGTKPEHCRLGISVKNDADHAAIIIGANSRLGSSHSATSLYMFIGTGSDPIGPNSYGWRFEVDEDIDGNLFLNALNNGTKTLSYRAERSTGNWRFVNKLRVGDDMTPTRTLDVTGDAAISQFLDMPSISAPANPAIGVRRIFTNTATGELSVRTNGGTTVSLEAVGGGISDGDKGDITVSGSGATWTIDADAVTYAKLQNVATDRLLGRDTAASGDVEEITVGGGLEFTGSVGIQRSALTGDVTASAGSGATAIAGDAVTDAKLRNSAATSVIGRSAGTSGDPADISASADGQVLRRAGGTLGFGAVDLADSDAVTGTLPAGNLPASVVLDTDANAYTAGQKQSVTHDATNAGLRIVPASGDPSTLVDGDIWYDSGTAKFRKRENGATSNLDTVGGGGGALDDLSDVTITTPAAGAVLKYDGAGWIDGQVDLADTDAITGTLAGANIADNAVTYAKIQDVTATDKVLGRSTAGAGDVEEIACTAAGRALIDDTDAAAQRTTLGLGALATKSTVATADIDTTAVTFARMQDIATDRLLGRDTAATGSPEELTVSGGIVFTGSGGIALASTVVVEDAANTWTTGAQDMGGATSFEVPNGAGGTTVDATGEVCVDSTTGTRGAGTMNFYDGTAERVLTPMRSKSITVENPTATEDISIFFTNTAITIREMRAVLRGSATPSVTWTIRHSTTTDRSATGTEVVTSGTTTTSTTSGSDVTSFNDATVEADEFVWLKTTAQSGTVNELHVTIFYTEDA